MEQKDQVWNPADGTPFDVDLQWFAEDPASDPGTTGGDPGPAGGQDPPNDGGTPPETPPEGAKPRWHGTWVGQTSPKYRDDPEKLDDLLKHKNFDEVLDRMYEAESRAVASQAPETPEGYEFGEVEFPESLQGDEQKQARENLAAYLADSTNEIRQMAHELGMGKDAAQRVFKFFQDKVFGEWQAAQEAFEKAKTDGIEALKKEWKGDAEANAEIAKRAIQTFGGDELVAALDEAGVSNHPSITKAFFEIGKQMGEDTLVPGSKSGELSAEEQKETSLKNRYSRSPEMFGEKGTAPPPPVMPEHLKGRYPTMESGS